MSSSSSSSSQSLYYSMSSGPATPPGLSQFAKATNVQTVEAPAMRRHTSPATTPRRAGPKPDTLPLGWANVAHPPQLDPRATPDVVEAMHERNLQAILPGLYIASNADDIEAAEELTTYSGKTFTHIITISPDAEDDLEFVDSNGVNRLSLRVKEHQFVNVWSDEAVLKQAYLKIADGLHEITMKRFREVMNPVRNAYFYRTTPTLSSGQMRMAMSFIKAANFSYELSSSLPESKLQARVLVTCSAARPTEGMCIVTALLAQRMRCPADEIIDFHDELREKYVRQVWKNTLGPAGLEWIDGYLDGEAGHKVEKVSAARKPNVPLNSVVVCPLLR